jgi:hypothetical protein
LVLMLARMRQKRRLAEEVGTFAEQQRLRCAQQSNRLVAQLIAALDWT